MFLIRFVILSGLPWFILGILLSWKPLLTLSLIAVAIVFYWVGPELLAPYLPVHGMCPTPKEHQRPFLGVDWGTLITFYFPGLGAGWMQSLRYTGGKEVERGEATMPNSPFFLYNIHAIDPPEYKAFHWMQLPWIYMLPITTMARVWQHILRGSDYVLAWPLISFAGHDDIEQCLRPIRAFIEDPKNNMKKLVLAGSSRGASTMLGAVTRMTAKEQDHIAFVLLEGAFDSVPAIAIGRYGSFLGGLLHLLLPSLTRYDPMYPPPVALASNFPTHVPVLFVTSEADWHVPMAHTLRVRDAVRRSRTHDEDLHTLVLKRSHHSFYSTDDVEDQAAYRQKMAFMYERYGPYNSALDVPQPDPVLFPFDDGKQGKHVSWADDDDL